MDKTFRSPAKFPLNEEQCLAIGGHCYIKSNIVVQTMPPTYHRYCKHCGHAQHGHIQEDVAWKDIDNVSKDE